MTLGHASCLGGCDQLVITPTIFGRLGRGAGTESAWESNGRLVLPYFGLVGFLHQKNRRGWCQPHNLEGGKKGSFREPDFSR